MATTTVRQTFKRFLMVVILAVGLAYIEAAVVVYLREIFYPGGFTFPLLDQSGEALWKKLILVEVGREAATLVVLFCGACLIGGNIRTRLAWFLTLFASWDIFYYIWLKVLLNWPASSIMEWDILFLIPTIWAGPILAPVLISLVMLIMAAAILYRQAVGKPLTISPVLTVGFVVISTFFIALFCRAGLHVTQSDYHAYFHWPLFLAGLISALVLFARCWVKKK